MIYCCIVATLVLLCLAVILALLLKSTVKEHRVSAERKTDEAVEREMKRDFMDEGFENLMSYAVNGKNGFDDDK